MSRFYPHIVYFCSALFIGALLLQCQTPEEQKMDMLFHLLDSTESGIDFNNEIKESISCNILNFHYIYNGGGVGVADFNNDGLKDLVFSGNQVPSKLYLNRADLRFEDVTTAAHFSSEGWGTGVSIVDINGDGWQDIYLSVGGLDCDGECYNQLFIHQGLDHNDQPYFQEMAHAYGLEDGLYTQQALFFDYDTDGDLDVYLLHNVIDERDKNAPSAKHLIDQKSGDQLLENQGNGTFKDVSAICGIQHRGYGLGVTVNDFNNDNLPDIYVANDFLSDDLLYFNLGSGPDGHNGFAEVGHRFLKHTSYNAMGVDVADVNNDQLPDIFVLDMMPAYNERQKTMLGFMNYNKFLYTLRQGYMPQFIRNTLQVHNGFSQDSLLPFSELGYQAGIYQTDWSWTPLLADFDNDGDRDLYVTNGYGKDITDLDFINYSSQLSPFGTTESREKELYDKVAAMQSVTMSNYIFENQGDLNFQNRSQSWIAPEKSISNGAVYVDLDNDGDLDLVVNNINQPASILENSCSELKSNNYLSIQLSGSVTNPSAIGAKVQVWTKAKAQTLFQSPVRGYLSSVDQALHFGLADASTVDSIIVTHPVYGQHYLGTTAVNQTLVIDLNKESNYQTPALKQVIPLLQEQYVRGLSIAHQENIHSDFDKQPLLLQQLSRQGPCLASADVDGKAGDEIFVGGAKGFPGQILNETSNGTYHSQFLTHAECEDTAATFFDFDGDGDLDLYVVSGGTEYPANHDAYQDRLYLNDGRGQFSFATQVSIPAKSSGSCVVANDYDQDGDIDLFIGGRIVPGEYPQIPRSYLLVNEQGRLIDHTAKLAYPLDHAGMISDAVWSDYDQDGWDDLVLVGEWMPITIFKNTNGIFAQKNVEHIEASSGLWNTITSCDIDQDGDDDYLLGNLGTNSRLKASPQEPLLLYHKDFDNNGSLDPLIGHYAMNKAGKRALYPIHARDDLVGQLTSIKDRFFTYADFGHAQFDQLLENSDLTTDFLRVELLESCLLENQSGEQSNLIPLPQQAQTAPLQAFLVKDITYDGQLEILLAGNDFTSEKNNGWYDSFNGLLLHHTGSGLEPMPISKSGFIMSGDARSLISFTNSNGQQLLLGGSNGGALQVFTLKNQDSN